MDHFDSTTLAFDVFRDQRNDLIMTCPPLWNLTPLLRVSSFRARFGGGQVRPQVHHRHLHDMIVLPDCGRHGAEMIGPLGRHVLRPSDDESSRFDGRRVLMTMSKDNDLCWIQDWMRFHRDVHGADAMLLFDNNSTAYTTSELCEAVGVVDGFRAVDVVAWPFRYGPQGARDGSGWDSHFSQLGMLETARRRYLRSAAAVMNADVDELVVPRRDAGSAFATAIAVRRAVIAYHGVWAPNISGAPDGSAPRHADFHHLERIRWERCSSPIPHRSWFPNKWTVVPFRTPDSAQWMMHSIRGVPTSRIASRHYVFAHFRALSNSWKYDRQRPDVFDPHRHVRDADMAVSMSRVRWEH